MAELNVVKFVERPPTRLYEVRTVHGEAYRAEGDVIESGDGWFTLWADESTLALRMPEVDIRAVRMLGEHELEAEDAPDCLPGCCVDNDSLAPTTCAFCGSRERCVNHPGEEALARGVPGHPFSPSGPQPDEPNHAADELRELVDEARQWARHGYEIGQRHCSWSDHGVAPAWLTEGWPRSFDSCEHLAHAAAFDEALTRVRNLPTEPEAMNANQPHQGVWLDGYRCGVLAAKSATRPRDEKASRP